MGSLKVMGLEKSYGIRTLFSNVNFEVMHGDKIGLVGANGSGKTTLMRILLGREESDGGRVVMDFTDTVGYVEQQADFSGDTLYDELRGAFSDIIALGDEKGRMEQHIASGRADAAEMAAYGNLVTRFEAMDGYDFESRIRRVAFGLGFSEADLMKDVRHFSGGQTTRICLAKALLREPDFLFLDEPTNHLDIGMIEWLEKFLQSYRGGVLLISHDRYFLDRIATRILELDHAEITAYTGNYTHYMRVKNERRAALQNAYKKQQEHIRKTEEYISRYKAGIKAKQRRRGVVQACAWAWASPRAGGGAFQIFFLYAAGRMRPEGGRAGGYHILLSRRPACSRQHFSSHTKGGWCRAYRRERRRKDDAPADSHR